MSDRVKSLTPHSVAPGSHQQPSRGVVVLLLAAGAATLLLYGRSLAFPVLFYDDFQIFTESRTWQRARATLWVPHNEHAMPLGRLFCFALDSLTGRLPVLPYLSCLVGPLALLTAMLLVYVLVRRELGQRLYAVLAVVLFGVTSVYHQAVWWFAASFSLFSLDTMLLGLLAVQRFRQTGRTLYLDLAVLACLLAPGWFAIGILGGPLCCLYLLPPSPPPGDRRQESGVRSKSVLSPVSWLLSPASWRGASTRHWTLLPFLGTVLFLAVSLPRTAEAILHTGHYGERTALQAFDPLTGLAYTLRSLVDNLVLGLVGVTNVALPIWIAVPILLVIAASGAWWWRQAPDHRLMLLGLGLIGSSYMLVYSARSTWDYRQMTNPGFARYHLLPQLGLVLFFCGGLPGRAGRWFSTDENDGLNQRQRRQIYALIGVLLLIHLPRGLLCGAATDWDMVAERRDQQDALRRIEEVDARCRQHHIDAAAAREALGRLEMPLSMGVVDGWELLRGSDDPRPLPPEEIRCLLDAP